MLGHIDILGDPLSLGKNISSGVIGFVKKVRINDESRSFDCFSSFVRATRQAQHIYVVRCIFSRLRPIIFFPSLPMYPSIHPWFRRSLTTASMLVVNIDQRLTRQFDSCCVVCHQQTGSGQIGEGSKDLVKGVVGGTASSASKMTDALDHIVRGAGNLDGDGSSDTENRMETAKVG